MTLLATAVFACQLLAAVPQNPPQALDVIELKNGDTLEGRITTEIDGYLELELQAGAVLGLSSAQIAAVRRGVVPVKPASAMVLPRGEWFVLHDATGQAVGWLQSSVTQRADGGFTVNEEYEFQHGVRRYQVTAQATADVQGTATRSYYRERICEPILSTLHLPGTDSGAHERVVDERIVEAVVRGERLAVHHLDRTGRRERDLGWPAGASFPLLVRTLTRASGKATGPATLFDPATEEFVVRSYDGSRQRAVVLGGKTVQVTEVAETTATGRNAEWIDATARTVRRELAGPALVAMPSRPGSDRFVVTPTIASAIAAEAGGTFGLWVPNPAWVVRDDMPAGQVLIANAAHDAGVSLTRIDHLEASTPLDAAADAIANWFALLHPELTVRDRSLVQVRDRTAVRLTANGRSGEGASRAVLDVIPHQGHFLVLACIAPASAWEELATDFEFFARSIELEAQSLTPKLQGPLASRKKSGAKKATPPHTGPQNIVPGTKATKPAATAPLKPAPKAASKTPPPARDKSPNVRIPGDE
jgi:hypothetical protein